MEHSIAVWQCSRCGDTKRMQFPSCWTFARTHLCFGSSPQQYTRDGTGIVTGIVYAGIYQPLNEMARAIDAGEVEYEARKAKSLADERDRLAAWPPAPCDRFHWEARF